MAPKNKSLGGLAVCFGVVQSSRGPTKRKVFGLVGCRFKARVAKKIFWLVGCLPALGVRSSCALEKKGLLAVCFGGG